MPTIQINNFGGIVPRIHPTLLPANCATKAHNCVLKSGKLVPMKESSVEEVMTISMDDNIEDLNHAKTIYKWDTKNRHVFLLFKNDLDCVRGNFLEDEQHKIFIAGQTNVGEENKDICVVYENSKELEYKVMSMYKPAPPELEVVRESQEKITDENIRYTFFFSSWIDELGYESEMSNPSNEVEYIDGDAIAISGWDDPPLDAKKRRIYKVITGLETNNIQFVMDQDINEETYSFPAITIQQKDEDAGELAPSISNAHKKVNGICYVSGGFYAMWCSCSPKTVRFSEGSPNNFPEEYSYEVEYEIVGLASTGNNVFVITTGNPYVISGSTPDAMVATKLSSYQGCVDKRTICVMDGSVFYVSQDGICMLTEGSASAIVVTKDYFSKREWAEVINGDMIMCGYDDTLYLWKMPVGEEEEPSYSYTFSFIDKTSGITTFDEQTTALSVDPVSDKMFYVKKIEDKTGENVDE